MTYSTRKEESERDGRYEGLENRAANLIGRLSTFWADSANLRTDSPPGEKAEITALRDQFILDVRAQLGI